MSIPNCFVMSSVSLVSLSMTDSLYLYDSPDLLSLYVMCIFIKIYLLYIGSNNSFPNMTAVEPKSLFPLIGTLI